MSTDRLFEIKKQIDEAIPKQSEIAGKIQSEEERIEQEFKVKKIPEMEKKLEDIGKEIDEEEAKFKKEMEKLENAYNWD